MSLEFEVSGFKFGRTIGKIQEGGEGFKTCGWRNVEISTIVDLTGSARNERETCWVQQVWWIESG
jgi:hypothetical protein